MLFSQFFPIQYDVIKWVCHHICFLLFWVGPTIPSLLRVFNIKGCWHFYQMLFSVPLLRWSLASHLIVCIYHIYWLAYTKHPLHPLNKTHLISVLSFSDMLLIQLAGIEDFGTGVHQRILVCVSRPVVLPGFGIRGWYCFINDLDIPSSLFGIVSVGIAPILWIPGNSAVNTSGHGLSFCWQFLNYWIQI